MRPVLLLPAMLAVLFAGEDFPALRPRPAWKPDLTLSRREVPWQRLLENREIRFLTDNQFSLTLNEKPGIAKFHFYPVRKRVELSGKLDYGVLAKQTQFEGQGAEITFRSAQGNTVPLREAEYSWRPERVVRTWGGTGSDAPKVLEEIAVSGNLAVIRLTRLAGPALQVRLWGSFPYAAQTRTSGGRAVFCFANGVSVALASGAGKTAAPVKGGYALDATLDSHLEFVAAIGYTPELVAEELNGGLRNPAGVFEGARQTWDRYFTALVPHLATANATLDRLYYYLFYVVRSSLFDIPWEPYGHAYTCPWKTGAIWQWSWNTPMNAVTERWLNDSSLSKEGIRLIAENGGGLYFGTYLHPRKPAVQRQSIFTWYREVDQAQKQLARKDYDFLTVIPYTVPNSFLGVWEVYRMTGDRQFLQASLPLMRDYERAARNLAPKGSLLAPFQMMVDEFDYSLRWKPVQATFTKGGQQRAFDVPVTMVDVNSYLYALRKMLAAAYAETGQMGAAAEMRQLAERTAQEINQKLWDGKKRFYCDARADNGASTGVRAISGFAPLYVGIVPLERQEALVEALADPKLFGSPYPVPSIELDHPDLDPNLLTYGGDSLITTGVWTVVNALAEHGQTARASQYLARAIDLVTRDGVSSSYSYNPVTAHPNQRKHQLSTQCAILNDLIGRYVVGLTPRNDDLIEFQPIAASIAGERLSYGPFRYKDRHWIRVEMSPEGWRISVDEASVTLPKPQHTILRLEPGGKLRLLEGGAASKSASAPASLPRGSADRAEISRR